MLVLKPFAHEKFEDALYESRLQDLTILSHCITLEGPHILSIFIMKGGLIQLILPKQGIVLFSEVFLGFILSK